MKFEVSLINPKMTQAQETMRRLSADCSEIEISERDE